MLATEVIGPAGTYIIWIRDNEDIPNESHLESLFEILTATRSSMVPWTGFWPAGTSTLRPFPEVKVDPYGFDERGLPGWGVIWVNIKGENRGWEASKLVCDFDRDATDLPSLFDPDFVLDEDVSDSLFYGASRNIEGRTPFEAYLQLNVRIAEQDRQAFARALNSLKSYCVVMNHHTKSIVGEPKPHTTALSITGDFQEFRQKILDHWRHSKHCDLAQLAESQ